MKIMTGPMMSMFLADTLKALQVQDKVIKALRDAMQNITDPFAMSYSAAMDRALEEYGLHGVKVQVLYLLTYGRKWQGEEAREAKKVLNKWATSK